jgi:hypothetical protein
MGLILIIRRSLLTRSEPNTTKPIVNLFDTTAHFDLREHHHGKSKGGNNAARKVRRGLHQNASLNILY